MSCKVYHLKIEDNQWQPYQKGDVLVFQNSKRILDTIIVSSSKIKSEKTIEPYNFLNRRKEYNISHGFKDEKYIGLVRISKDKNESYLNLSGYTIYTDFGIHIPIKDLIKFLKIDKTRNEIYLIDKFKDYYHMTPNFPIHSILYSKKLGYLKINFKDGEFYELVEFIRNGKNLY
ncbi:hypothetical protein [Aureivirga marina]|uniref:hypothetical protein n=1 Tax=Aureivirga marina TaxID=1182451 RepID=UPI0018C9E26F|nr:hypothetical protein [Aureivirga marina]